jgi:hypothetical protein
MNLGLFKDKIKNALTKNKNPLKKYRPPPPKKKITKIAHGFSPKKNTKKTPNITKRIPKITIRPLLVLLVNLGPFL